MNGNEVSVYNRKPGATRINAALIGVLLGICGMDHGIFEILQGSKPTEKLVIQAIGTEQRFYAEGTEEAFTLIPDFLASGITATCIGFTIIIWSLFFIGRKNGRNVFLGLCIALFLSGGGIGQVVLFIPTWILLKGLSSPTPFWQKSLKPKARPILARLWPVFAALNVLSLLIGVEMAVFGLFPGIHDPEAVSNAAMLFVLAGALFNVLSFITGFAKDMETEGARE
ncbi:MAG: hypothetical protein JW874_05095 [Spirochaetales bacterium]|nr:hypothetical protein [Spirochaetales bacterium]